MAAPAGAGTRDEGRRQATASSGWRSIRPMRAASQTWVDPTLRTALLHRIDADGWPRTDDWSPGTTAPLPADAQRIESPAVASSDLVADSRSRRRPGARSAEAEIVRLFQARGDGFAAVCAVRRCAAARGVRRRRLLCRDPQHQLHQHLFVQMPVLRLLEGQDEREPARAALQSVARGDRHAGERSLGARRHRSLHAGRHPSGFHRRYLSRHLPRRARGRARHARSRLFAARGASGRGHARSAGRGISSCA